MAAIRWIIGFIITICIAVLAIINRNDVSFTWSPVHDTVTLPLYIIALLSMASGFILGGTLVWINSGKTRKERRRQKKEIKLLEKEIERLKDDKLSSTDTTTDIITI